MRSAAQPAWGFGSEQRSKFNLFPSLFENLKVIKEFLGQITYFPMIENDSRKDRDLANIGPGSYAITLADKKSEPRYG